MNNLLSLVFELCLLTRNQSHINPWYGWAAQSIALRAVKKGFSSRFSNAMHVDNLRRAYTASSLFSDGALGEEISSEDRCFLRYTALNEDSALALISTTQPGQPLCAGSQIDLAGLRMEIIGIYINPLQHPLADATSYEVLWDSTAHTAMSLGNRITFKLDSPTFFKSTQTGRYTHQPTAALVFGSLFDRWKLFASTQKPDDFLVYARDAIQVLQQDLEIFEIESKGNRKYARQGSKGWITFSSLEPGSQYWVFAHILARYALFAGVGKETARGFGQCRVLTN